MHLGGNIIGMSFSRTYVFCYLASAGRWKIPRAIVWRNLVHLRRRIYGNIHALSLNDTPLLPYKKNYSRIPGFQDWIRQDQSADRYITLHFPSWDGFAS